MTARAWGQDFLIALGILTSVTLGSLAIWTTLNFYTPYKGYSDPHQIVTIRRGATTNQIGSQLESRGVIRSALFFKWYLRLLRPTDTVKAGEYQFANSRSLLAIVKKIGEGRVHYRPLLIPEGLTAKQTVERLVSQDSGTNQGFHSALRDTDSIRDLDPQANDLEGYLFPDTYFVTRGLEERDIVHAMVTNFRERWTPKRLARAKELNLTTREVVTLASLIEKETHLGEERALISAVFHNRLARRIKLQCDPTVIYAVSLIKDYDGVINQSDLLLDSPYNTYRYAGLPPGPIASPGIDSIDAALYPADVNYLYFVARKDGGHFFAQRYRDHRRAVERYRR